MKVINIVFQVDFSCFYVFSKVSLCFSSGNTQVPQKNACLIPHCECVSAFTLSNAEAEALQGPIKEGHKIREREKV